MTMPRRFETTQRGVVSKPIGSKRRSLKDTGLEIKKKRMDEMNDRILDLVKERMAKGRAQYGHGLLEKSGYDWVQEALEEALDLSIYVAARLVEIKNTPPPASH